MFEFFGEGFGSEEWVGFVACERVARQSRVERKG